MICDMGKYKKKWNKLKRKIDHLIIDYSKNSINRYIVEVLKGVLKYMEEEENKSNGK